MMPLRTADPKKDTRWRLAAVTMFASALLLIGTVWHSTASGETAPIKPHASPAQPSDTVEQEADRTFDDAVRTPDFKKTAFAPFLDIVPSQDGTALFISAAGGGQLGGTLFANIGIGPGHHIGSYTMVYSETADAHVTTAGGFFPQTGASGPLSITSTLGLDTGAVDFNREYLPDATTGDILSIDGRLQLRVVSTDTFPSEAYIAVVPSYAPPGPPPLGHRLVGSAYSVRASGAVVVADRPMSLRLYYDDTTLAGADPHTLSIFAWDAFHKRWDNMGGRLFYDQRYLSIATSRFTTYALMTTPAWRDEFDDFYGLNWAETDNVTWGPDLENRTLILSSTPGNGTAVSQPITPTAGFDRWDSLTFVSSADPPTTTLTVDILALNGTPVLTDVTSGADLNELDADLYPALKLRAYLSSAVTRKTPALDMWQLTWRKGEHQAFLPITIK